MSTVREPAVAGSFYPLSARALAGEISTCLASVRPAENGAPKVLIVPHAGYVYSGPVAASAYATLNGVADRIRRVVLLGPAHRVWVRGVALPNADAFRTPLGEIAVDAEAVARLRAMPQVVESQDAHRLEHSLEVQLPFLQAVLPSFALVPLVVGEATPEEVAEVIEALWGGDETLIVVSSDLSHYLPYREAKEVDRATADAILQGEGPISHDQACGGTPINGLLLVAGRRRLQPRLLDLRNSGDTAGDRSRVVGYGAFAFFQPYGRAH